LLVIGGASSEAQSPVKQVLILQSLDRGNLVLDQFTGEFRINLHQELFPGSPPPFRLGGSAIPPRRVSLGENETAVSCPRSAGM